MALFKICDDGSWLRAENIVITPTVEITKDNLQDRWLWYDDDPVEYIEYINSINVPPVSPDIVSPYV